MGPNLTEKALQTAARSVSGIHAICKQYDRESGVPVQTQTRFYDGAEVVRAPPSSPIDSLLLCCMFATSISAQSPILYNPHFNATPILL